MDIRDHGRTVEGKKHRVQCNYCDKEMSGFFRLKYHLGGVRGDVTPCEKVSENVRELFRNILQESGRPGKEVKDLFQRDLPFKRNGSSGMNVAKKVRRQSSESFDGETESEECNGSTDSMQEGGVTEPEILPCRQIVSLGAVSGDGQEPSSKQNKRCIGRFFYETGMDFKVVNSPSFQRMINDIHCPGQTRCKIPSCQELKGWILKEEVKEMQEYVKKIRQSWASTGCSILLDGWIDEKGRNLVSFIVDCPQGPIYLHSSDISASIDDVNSLHLLLNRIIDEVGAENVVQIIAFSSEGWVGDVGNQFMDRCKKGFWSVDASHCIELILDKIAQMREIRRTLEKAETISKFIYGHMTVLNLLRDYTDGHDLIKPTKVKSAMPFVTLQNMISEKNNIKALFSSSEWKTSTWAVGAEGKMVAELVADSSFWKGATMVVKITLPLIHILGFIKGDNKPQMGYIYETMDQLKETIREELNGKKPQYMPVWKVIDEIWDGHLHSPLHAAGYFFNPNLFYSTDFQFDSEVMFGLLCCVVRMIQNQSIQDKIIKQLDAYRHSRGAFEEGSTVQERTKHSPALWWSIYGEQCPELQQLAIRILSQTCVGASKYRLNRGLAEKLLTKGRLPIEQQLLGDLTFVHYNLQLQLQHSQLSMNNDIVADEIDPIDEWIVDDAPETVSQNGGPAWNELESSNRSADNGGRPSFQVKEEPR